MPKEVDVMFYLKQFAQNYAGDDGKFSPEAFQQSDTLQEMQADFMYDVLNLAGYVEES